MMFNVPFNKSELSSEELMTILIGSLDIKKVSFIASFCILLNLISFIKTPFSNSC